MSTVLAVELRHDPASPSRRKPRNLRGNAEEFAQQIEAAEDAGVGRQQRLVLVEADLLERAVLAPAIDDRIAEFVEMAEMDADAVGEELLVERDRVGLRAEQMEASVRWRGSRQNQLAGFLRRLRRRRLLLAARPWRDGVSVRRRPASSRGADLAGRAPAAGRAPEYTRPP